MTDFQPIVKPQEGRIITFFRGRFFKVFLILVILIGLFFIYQYFSQSFEKKLYKGQTVTDIDENNVSFLSLSSDDKYIFYLDSFDRTLKKIPLASQTSEPEKIGDLNFIPKEREITNLKWSADKSKIYVFTSLGDSSQIYLYDLVNNQNKKMDTNIIDIDFLGDKAVYLYFVDEQNFLTVADYNGANWRNIKTVSRDFYNLKPSDDNSKIVIWGMGVENGKSLKVVDINSGEINDIDSGVIDGVQFSPDNSKLLYSKTENSTTKIFTSDPTGQIKNLNSNVYLNQFVWKSNGSIIYITYTQVKDGINFEFYTVSTKDAKKQLINRIPKDSANDPNNLAVTKDGKILFFTNNNQLQKVSL